MDFSHKLAISYYKTIAVLNEPHHIYLVQHQETKKIFVKKVLDVYNIDIYDRLKSQTITGTPKIIDTYEENDQLIVIEEYISGTSLSEKIQNSDFSKDDCIRWMLDLCHILNELHSLKPAVIHRDIKPSNVMITAYNHAVLLDFNAAKYHSLSESEDTVLLGTQGYAAPEQYGFGSSSPQTDIYALGILLKEMTGSINETSDQFSAIITKCTQLNPAERFQNVRELEFSLLMIADPKLAKPSSKHSFPYAPPGYRTMTPWKMIVSSAGYFFIFRVSLNLKVKDTYGIALWIERIFVLMILLFFVCGTFNYMNIQKLVPLCSHEKRLIRYLGTALLDLFGFLVLMLLLISIEITFFQ